MAANSTDVARAAGVSRGAVSQILNGHDQRFSAATRDRVLQAARELEYHPSAAAQTLARGTSSIIVAMVPDTTFGGILYDIFITATAEFAAHGLTCLFVMSTPTGESLDRVVSGMRPRVVFSFTEFTLGERRVLAAHDVPYLDPKAVLNCNVNVAIGAFQAEALISQGYHQLAFAHLDVGWHKEFGRRRLEGIRRICRRHGVPPPQTIRMNVRPDHAVAALDTLGRTGFAIACYNDDVAICLLSAARLRGWRVPDDVAVIGTDRSALSLVTDPPLATVDVDILAIAKSMTSAALSAIGIGTSVREPMQLGLVLHSGGTI